jgi:hypothetical protein
LVVPVGNLILNGLPIASHYTGSAEEKKSGQNIFHAVSKLEEKT